MANIPSDSNIKKALEFLKEDEKLVKKIYNEGKPLESFLQRNNKTLSDLLNEKFIKKDDEDEFVKEYTGDGRSSITATLKRRLAFLLTARKEFHEDYDDEWSDVDFMRLLQVPYTDAKFVVEWSIDELSSQEE